MNFTSLALGLIFSFSAFADCPETAARILMSHGYRFASNSSLIVSAPVLRPANRAKKNITYIAEVNVESNDGASTEELPVQRWKIITIGNAVKCQVDDIIAL